MFNAYGQQTWFQTPDGNYTDYEYDTLGRMIKRYEHNVKQNTIDSTIWVYHTTSGLLGLLNYVSFNDDEQLVTYTYDNLNRVSLVNETRHNNQYNTSYTYDQASRIASVTYPTGFQVNKSYTASGQLYKLSDANNSRLWETLGKNAQGQVTSYITGDNLNTYRSYIPENGRLERILTTQGNDTVQHYFYNYDVLGNLAARTDYIHDMSESFIYDKLNRLTGIVEDIDTTGWFVYDAYGRMLSKYIHDEQVFDSAEYHANFRPHAIAQAKTRLDLPSHQMSYTPFDKLASLEQDTMTLTYLNGPLGVFGIMEQRSNFRPSRYYVHPDHLGSWTLVTGGAYILQDVCFDAWGTPYRFTATGTEPAPSLLFDRGFTGHEHLLYFGLINMNGRMYDPFTSGFLSVDNYVQKPDYTQSFNRYAYCYNNPLKYTDPNGEFAVVDAWLSGFIQGLFSSKENRLSNAWKKANQLAVNDAKIIGGLFRPDFNKGFWGRNWDILSRWTWEFPQTKAGLTFALASNLCGQVDNVEYYDGTTVSSGNNFGQGGAVTLGNYINGDRSLFARPDNSLFQHEYGHYLQSKATGPWYLSRYAIPSGLDCLGIKDHNYHPVEQDANIRAFKYFNKKLDNYSSWDFDFNPIVGYKEELPITNEVNQAALKNGRLQPAWYDYVFALSPTVGGLTIPITDGLINFKADGLINPMAGGALKIITAGLLNWWMLEDYEEP